MRGFGMLTDWPCQRHRMTTWQKPAKVRRLSPRIANAPATYHIGPASGRYDSVARLVGTRNVSKRSGGHWSSRYCRAQAAAQDEPAPLGRFESRRTDRHPVHARHRTAPARSACRDGVRLGHDRSATAARLPSSRSRHPPAVPSVTRTRGGPGSTCRQASDKCPVFEHTNAHHPQSTRSQRVGTNPDSPAASRPPTLARMPVGRRNVRSGDPDFPKERT